ncbi:carbohydrate-binding protein [Pseudooceanicola algae]|uniref:Uncharacterized protein n=1 Tax=Pseudooceanicola algae TaxID=1537215 RepID=A0A418SHL6_9RHOB|nr:carbohydrate-binding protein [Pseudooceanicola algae]QPM90453.1 hypothetical protein PSAL_016920 [Pseudooceanicola algae]
MPLTLSILDKTGVERARAEGPSEVVLVADLDYAPGDTILLTGAQPGSHLMLALDQGMAPALVYFVGPELRYPVPFGDDRIPYPPGLFRDARHRLWVREARAAEVGQRRNLALNPWDAASVSGVFPHGTANVETRGEAVFAARNALDGEAANHDHGVWPFTSWGINQDPEAALTLDFGREVVLDEIGLRLRADFPHDAWWQAASLVFSDGSEVTLDLKKTAETQYFALPPHKVTWLRLERLIKADDPSPFPALTQIEAWGV